MLGVESFEIKFKKKEYVKDTPALIFNLELLPFIKINDAKIFYNKIKESIMKIFSKNFMITSTKRGYQMMKILIPDLILNNGFIMVNLTLKVQGSI